MNDHEAKTLLKVPLVKVFNKRYTVERIISTTRNTYASANGGIDWIPDNGYKKGDEVEVWFVRESGVVSNIDWCPHYLRIDVNGKCLFDINDWKPNHVNYKAIEKISKIRKSMKRKNETITYPTELPNFFTVMSKV